MMAMTGHDYLNYGATVLTLVVLEGLLSADNALVLAVLVKKLPNEERGKALKYGILGAFFFRAIGVLLAGHLIKYWFLKAAGAFYLFFLAAKHFWDKYHSSSENSEAVLSADDEKKIEALQAQVDAGTLSAAEFASEREKIHKSARPKDAPSFWRVVVAVELTDIAFSIDSIIAAVALSDNIYVVYLGGILGIIAMRFVATFFLKLLDTYAALETSAYLLVAWIALKLSLEIIHDLRFPDQAEGHSNGMPNWLFWGVMAVLFFGAFVIKKKDSEPAAIPDETGAPK